MKIVKPLRLLFVVLLSAKTKAFNHAQNTPKFAKLETPEAQSDHVGLPQENCSESGAVLGSNSCPFSSSGMPFSDLGEYYGNVQLLSNLKESSDNQDYSGPDCSDATTLNSSIPKPR